MKKVLVLILTLCIACNVSVEAKAKKKEKEKTATELVNDIEYLKHRLHKARSEAQIDCLQRTAYENIYVLKKHIDEKFCQLIELIKNDDKEVDRVDFFRYTVRYSVGDVLYKYDLESFLNIEHCRIHYKDGTIGYPIYR